MKKTVKTGELIKIRNSTRNLVNDNSRPFPGKISYLIFLNYKEIQRSLEGYEEFEKNLLNGIKERGKLEVLENAVKITDPTEIQNYAGKISEAQGVEIEINLKEINNEEFENLLESFQFSVPEIEFLEAMKRGE